MSCPKSQGVRNLESGNFFSWNWESCALGFGIQIQKSGSYYRLESRTLSKFHWQRIRYPLPGIRNHRRGIQNLRLSWISLHGANCHWLRLWPPLKMCKQLHHVTGGHQLHWRTHAWTGRYCVRVPNQIINHHITFEKIRKHYYFYFLYSCCFSWLLCKIWYSVTICVRAVKK